MLTYGSVCSGIEAVSVGWSELPTKPLWFSEIEKFPCELLEHHYPDVLNVGDMTQIKMLLQLEVIQKPDILVGGTPCQAFSIAGMRKGLKDKRGQLTMTFVEIADEIKPKVILWENVPGVLSDKSNAFGKFIAALAGEDEELLPSGKKWSNAGVVSGPQRTIAWRILDAQYFGVAQRRRRVFVVACPRDGADPTKILFESESVCGNSPPSRSEREKVTGNVRNSSQVGYRMLSFSSYSDDETASTMKASDYKGFTDLVVGTLDTQCCYQNQTQAICISGNTIGRQPQHGGNGLGLNNEISPTLTTTDRRQYKVRRLTPTECERLQGFPDGYTNIPKSTDSVRYKALGNSMAVPVMKWLGERILKWATK